jgi:hypothetical protein
MSKKIRETRTLKNRMNKTVYLDFTFYQKHFKNMTEKNVY